MLLGRGEGHGVLHTAGGDVNRWVQREGQQRGEPLKQQLSSSHVIRQAHSLPWIRRKSWFKITGSPPLFRAVLLTTSKTASEAADALGYLALNGYDTEQMLATLKPIVKAPPQNGSRLVSNLIFHDFHRKPFFFPASLVYLLPSKHHNCTLNWLALILSLHHLNPSLLLMTNQKLNIFVSPKEIIFLYIPIVRISLLN